MTKKLVLFGIAVMITLLALVALWQFRSVVIMVLVSLALAATVRPLGKWLSRRGFALRLALILLFVLVFLGFSGALFALGGIAVFGEIKQLANTVAVQDEWKLPDWLQLTPNLMSLTAQLPPPSKLFAAITGDEGQNVLPAVIGLTRGFTGFFSSVFVVLFLSLYWSLNQVQFERLWLSMLPPGQRNRARNIWTTIEEDLGTYIRSQVIQSLLAGLLLGLGYWALGSPYPTLLAFAGALACLIPMIGVGLALILPLLLGLLTSVELSLITASFTVVVLIALEIWVKPRLFNHKQYNPILTVVVLLALAKAFGLIGVIAAPPLSAAIQIVWSHLVVHRAVAGSAAQISDLKERLILLRTAIQAMKEPHPRLVTSSMERLSSLIEKAEPVLQEELPVEPLEAIPLP